MIHLPSEENNSLDGSVEEVQHEEIDIVSQKSEGEEGQKVTELIIDMSALDDIINQINIQSETQVLQQSNSIDSNLDSTKWPSQLSFQTNNNTVNSSKQKNTETKIVK